MKNVILLAPPASGKGTQANLLKEKFNLIHISTGDLLRKAASRNDDFGIKLNNIMSSGTLVSDEIVIELLKENLSDNIKSNGFIFDGFPRNVNQALELDKLLESIKLNIDYVFLLSTDYDILLNRITGRRTCSKCGKIYNINNESRPLNLDICDDCGSNLIIRADDKEDSFKIRYQEYLDKTFPLIEYYKNQGKLISLDANKTIDEVFDNISSIMEN